MSETAAKFDMSTIVRTTHREDRESKPGCIMHGLKAAAGKRAVFKFSKSSSQDS